MDNKNSRRKFIKQSAVGLGAASFISPASILAHNPKFKKDNAEKLKIAGYPVNRVKALVEGKVKIDGFEHQFTKGSIGDLNTDTFVGNQTYDITEIGLHPYMLAYANDNFRDYTLLPIFPLRIFRHKSVFIRTDNSIKTPEDLRGKSIGTAGYSSSSLTWLRGIFQDEYGIKPEEVEWVMSEKDSSKQLSGNISKNEQLVPEGITLITGSPGKDESDLLISGEVDALFHAAEPIAFAQKDPRVGRLFADSRKVEQDYYKKTGIFPIMHAVAVRKKLLDNRPELVEDIFNAYTEAKKFDFQFMQKLAWAYDTLPWYAQEFEATQEVMGNDYWPYGIEKNRKVLETYFKYSFEQGLSKKELTIKELFHPNSILLTE